MLRAAGTAYQTLCFAVELRILKSKSRAIRLSCPSHPERRYSSGLSSTPILEVATLCAHAGNEDGCERECECIAALVSLSSMCAAHVADHCS